MHTTAKFAKVSVEFSGGLEMLFANRKRITIRQSDPRTLGTLRTIADLVRYLSEELMEDGRKEMFILDGNVRPGILVLVNDTDWDLEGGSAYELQDNDNVLFVSTLHGG